MPPERDAFLQCLVFGESVKHIPSTGKHDGDEGCGNEIDAHPVAFIVRIVLCHSGSTFLKLGC